MGKKLLLIYGALTVFSVGLIAWGFSFGGFGDATVPVTDSQLKAVNSILDAIETTLAEELKNINTNIYNLLRLKYEDFFKQNYQDEILRVWDLQDRWQDYQTLLKDLDDVSNQQAKLDKYIENAQLAGAYQTLRELPNLIYCLPYDQRSLAELYVSSTFGYYDLAQYGLAQLNLIPTCEEIYPDFGANIVVQKPIPQSRGFLSGLFANILKPFSLGRNFMLAQSPDGALTFQTIFIVPRLNDTLASMKMDNFVESVDRGLVQNIKNNFRDIPDPRDVVIPANQVRTDSGNSITLSYDSLVSFESIYNHWQELNNYMNQTITDFDFRLFFSTSSFATNTESSLPDICKKITAGEAKPLNPQVACAEALANFNVSLQEALQIKLERQKSLAETISATLNEVNTKIQDLKNSPTTTECPGYRQKLEELGKYTSSSLVHLATVTLNVSDVIAELTNNRVNINDQIRNISSTRAYVNKEYRKIIENVNNVLKTFKLRGIRGGNLFSALPLDFIQDIMRELEGHNFLLSLNKLDEIMRELDNALRSADNIASALGVSTNLFNDLRSKLRDSIKPISDSVLLKDYFEIYGIKVEVDNIERDMQNNCRSQIVRNNQQRFYAFKNNNNYFDLTNFQRNNQTIVKKIQPLEQQKGQNFFQKLLAKIFAPKIVEVNLR